MAREPAEWRITFEYLYTSEVLVKAKSQAEAVKKAEALLEQGESPEMFDRHLGTKIEMIIPPPSR